MRDLNYTLMEKRISRLERLIANEQLNQKNEFLGLGKKAVGSNSAEQAIEILDDAIGIDRWKNYYDTRGWINDSYSHTLNLRLTVSNGKRGSSRVAYDVTLNGRDLKNIRLTINREDLGGEETVFDKKVPFANPKQIKKAANIIMDNIHVTDLV